MQLLEALNWRYATKKMNGQPVPQDQVDQIIEAARLAPTCAGLQPYEILVITNSELKAKIQTIASGQTQIQDCSHLLIFAAWDNYTEQRFDDRLGLITTERNMAAGAMDAYKDKLSSSFLSREAHINFEHAARQAYIGFGIAIAAAAFLKVDATPMEGFDANALDNLLELHKKGLKSVSLLPLGYRDTTGDWLLPLKKVRVPLNEFVTNFN